MNKDFWKRPSFIASVVTLVCWLLLPYYSVKVYGYGVSASGLDLAKEFKGIDILLWLIPLLNAFMIWAAFNPTHNLAKASNIRIAGIVFLIVAAFFWARYGFLMEFTKLSYVGFGLWITLLAAIFIMFEGPIMKQINQMSQKSAGGNAPPPPPTGGTT